MDGIRRVVSYLRKVKSLSQDQALRVVRGSRSRWRGGTSRDIEVAFRGGGSVGGGTTLLLDTFTGGAGVLTSHTMDTGPGWTADTGTWSLNGSGQVAADGTGGSRIVSDSGASDVVITCDVTIEATGGPIQGVIGRWQDTSNFWSGTWETTGGGTLTIYKRVATVESAVATAAKVLTEDVSYTFRMTFSGTTVSLTVDGTTIQATGQTDLQTETHCGMRAGSSVLLFDNFRVTT